MLLKYYKPNLFLRTACFKGSYAVIQDKFGSCHYTYLRTSENGAAAV